MKWAPRVALVVSLFSTLLIAQTPPQMPKPGPEQKNLGYFAGIWKLTGDVKPGPMGPGGKFTGTERVERMPGGFFLRLTLSGNQSHGKGNRPCRLWL